jgi:hypothetical protein
MPKFRKRPIVIEAVQWTGENAADVTQFAGDCFRLVPEEYREDDPLRTAEVFDVLHATWMGLRNGQWVIKGIRGEFYPHDESMFAEIYEPAGGA